MSYSWQLLTTLAATDGDFTTAQPCSLPQLTAPIPGDNSRYLLTQSFMQYLANFTPLALNTTHPDFTNYYLTNEGPLTDMGGGVVRWTREYCKIPGTLYEWETTVFQYPGVIDIGTTYLSNNTSRQPYSVTTLSRVEHDYYIVDSSGTLPGGYTNPGQIPAIRQTVFCSAGTLMASGVKVGAAYDSTQYIAPVNSAAINGALYVESVPPTSTYLMMVADAGSHAWNATPTVEAIVYDTATNANYIPLTGGSAPVWGGIINAEDSRLSRYRGNIYVRTLRQVLAR